MIISIFLKNDGLAPGQARPRTARRSTYPARSRSCSRRWRPRASPWWPCLSTADRSRFNPPSQLGPPKTVAGAQEILTMEIPYRKYFQVTFLEVVIARAGFSGSICCRNSARSSRRDQGSVALSLVLTLIHVTPDSLA
jgi:hypothetical protein